MYEETLKETRFTGYYPGVIGKVTEIHAVYYYENWGFDVTFEAQVGRELSCFMENLREGRDYFRAAQVRMDFAGSIAIDGSSFGGEGARLRWYIVDPRHHGTGIGGLLLENAVEFCRYAGHKKIFLWTFEGLHSARRLYERVGFRLTEEHQVDQWGTTIREQKFELDLG